MKNGKEEGAIVTDAPEGQESEVVVEDKVELSPREKIMEKVAQGRRDEIKEEIEEAGGKIEFDAPEANLSEAETVAAGEDLEVAAGEETTIVLDADETTNHDLKVDGQEVTVSSDEINDKLGTEGEITDDKVVEFQKQATGDKRLEEAANQRKINETRASELATREAELAVLRNTPAGAEAVEIDPEMVGKLGDAFLVEDHGEAATILAQIVNDARGPAQSSQPAITKEDLNDAALNAASTLRYNEDLVDGQKKVKEAYPHLHDGGVLQQSMDSEAARIFELDRTKPPTEILNEAAASVQAKILVAAGGEEKSLTNITNSKKQAASKHNTPKGASTSFAPAKEKAAQSRKQVTASIVEQRNAQLSGRPAS